MKVGCIGLGDIALKAYLPVLTTQPDLELHLHTRTPATLTRVAERLHIPAERRHTDLCELLGHDLDAAFVHAPTLAHPEIVTRLLEAGVATYVDKPMAYELADSDAWCGSRSSGTPAWPLASTGATHPATPSARTTRAS